MKLLLKIVLIVVGLYCLFWGGVAAYFSFAERHKELLEANLGSLFKREVTIEQVRTAWRGAAPIIQINGFKVAGDTEDLPALAFESMSAELEPFSILKLWPKLTDFAVEAPVLEVAHTDDGGLQIAGIPLSANRASGISPKRLISWLMNHQSVSWHDGAVVWRRPNGVLQRYRDVSFVYEREQQNRTLTAATITNKGALAISAEANGNMLEDTDWDATVEVLGDEGQRLLSSDDLSLVVENGRGRAQLKALSVERVRDFLLLTGLSEAARWVIDAQLGGVLNNVQFDFSGPFLRFEQWELIASASDINFLPTERLPGMNHLSGSITATREGGTFRFASDDSNFRWPRWFPEDFNIEQTEGSFRWEMTDPGVIDVYLEEAVFSDGIVQINSLDAHCRVNTRYRKVGVLADWFTAGPIEDLRFEDGQIVSRSENAPLFLQAKANLSISDMGDTSRYLPADPRVQKLINWWEGAFVTGVVESADLSFEGPLNLNAIRDGSAQIRGIAEFENVVLDYGFQRDWPVLRRGAGTLELDNQGLTITPKRAWIEQDELKSGVVTIKPIFEKGRVLNIKGEMESTLETVADFLFEGPLLSDAQKKLQAEQPFPLTAQGGVVDADVDVTIPLNDIKNTKVDGRATVSAGRLILPPNVALENIRTNMTFTEASASAERIRADFLGGTVEAKLSTTEVAQPPKLKLTGSGRADVAELQPWIGEHLLSWFQGEADWVGEVKIEDATVMIDLNSELEGVTVSAPAPLKKDAQSLSNLNFAMRTGGQSVVPELALDYGDHLRVHMLGDPAKQNLLLDRARIVVADEARSVPRLSPPGVNFMVEKQQFDLDAWLEAIIELASLETTPLAEGEVADTTFLDAMRTVQIESAQTQFLGRPFGPLRVSAVTTDGNDWIGTLKGDNMDGTIKAKPRTADPRYDLNLAYFHLVEAPKGITPPEPINPDLRPADYPTVSLNANTFVVDKKKLGRLLIEGAPTADSWNISQVSLDNTDISTTGSGQWINDEESGSNSSLSLITTIDEAGGVLDEMQFNDLIRQGQGRFNGELRWIGAPHEFDFARLNGEFDLQVKDGELIRVESGAGRLIGLLNFNSILRRLTLDFRDVFSSGLKFDKMQYTGIIAEGKAIMREAFMLSPAVFVQMEGNIDLHREEIDMEIHASPELGGNLALLSAIANPTAGAVVFLTQRIFKDQMRSNSLLSYRALGTWKDFELAEIDSDGQPVSKKPSKNKPSGAGE